MVANLFTFLRAVGAAALLATLIIIGDDGLELATAFGLAAWATDMVDGWLARYYRTGGGDVDLDGIADSVLSLAFSAGLYWTPFGHQHTVLLSVLLVVVWIVTGLAVMVGDESRVAVSINMALSHGLVFVVAIPSYFAFEAFGTTVMGLWLAACLIAWFLHAKEVHSWVTGTKKYGTHTSPA